MVWGLYLTVGYIATSTFFFCFPELLRKKRTFKDEIFNSPLNGKRISRIWHRGAPRYTT